MPRDDGGAEAQQARHRSDGHRLGGRETHDRARRPAAHAHECLLLAAAFATCGRNDGRQERSEHHPGEAEEEEEELGIDGVGSGGVEASRQVVADQPGPGECGLEVLRSTHDLSERRAGVRRERPSELDVELRRDTGCSRGE